MPTLVPGQPDSSMSEIEHQGDVDRTQIALFLAMTPTERLRHHEWWRLFEKEALELAEIRRNNCESGKSPDTTTDPS